MMDDGIDKDELRRLVREVLQQTLHGGEKPAKPAAAPANMTERMRHALLPGGSAVVEVEGDLNAFARDIVHAAAHEDLKAALMSGKLAFRPAEQGPGRDVPAKGAGSVTVNDGMLNELRIEEIGRRYGTIVLGPTVVVTPLARDRARELKLELVRTKA